MNKPFRFGLMTASAASGGAVKDLARKAEALGYDTLLYNDHYAGPGPAMAAANHMPQSIASIPAVTLAAAVTERLHVGFRVLCADYHNPTVLAKTMATLDLFSEGRLEVGIGAGWIGSEYEAMGIPFDPPGKRIRRLAEVVEILKQSFGDGEVHVEGREGVSATGYTATPKPIRKPRPPITIGGGGRKVLELAAREADIVAFNVNNRSGKLAPDNAIASTGAATQEKVNWVRAAAGDRFRDIELEIGAYFVIVTDDVEGAAANLGPMTYGMFDMPVAEVLDHPHVLIGPVERIRDTLVERRERYGFNYVTVRDASIDDFAPIVAQLAGV